MDILEAIRTRRSIGRVKPDPVDRQLVEQVLEAAVYAPNHFLTAPWKFIVLTGEGRNRLGKAYAAIQEESMEDASTPENQAKLINSHNNAFRAPVVIVIVVQVSDRPRVVPIEEYASTHAAVQNMLLTAHAQGLGAVWRTGDAAYHPKMKESFGLSDHEHVAGFIYLGHPDLVPPPRKYPSITDKAIWLENE